MRDLMSKIWWAILLRGIAGIAFGILTFLKPGITLETLVLLFGVFAIVGGAFEIVGAISQRGKTDDWWVWLLQGLVGVVVGVVTFRSPGITTLALLFFIAIWALATGVLQIVAAIRLRREIKGEGWLIVGGLASVALAIILMVDPGAGALGLVLWIGAMAFLNGIIFTWLALRLRKPMLASPAATPIPH